MAEPANDTRNHRCTGAEALAYLLDARHGADIDRPPPPLDETLELFRLYYRQTPIERIGFMVLARIYARLDDAAAGKLILQAGELVRRKPWLGFVISSPQRPSNYAREFVSIV